MIEVDHVAKRFGLVEAVRDVSFAVAAGEILGFLGPNGAGKTTTMRMLTGFYPPTQGAARVAGLDVFENALAVRKKIGYLPENVPLYGDMTVWDYLRFVADIKGLDRSRRITEMARVMEACQLEDVRYRMIKKISKGYRQRVGLAQALIGDPDVLILDEPTIGLDPRQINEIRSVIQAMAGRKTVILCTHILAEVAMICHRVVIVNRGRVLAEDNLVDLRAKHQAADTVRLKVGGTPAEVVDTLARVPGVTQVTEEDGALVVRSQADVRAELARAVVETGRPLLELTTVALTLEDIFIKLVTRDEEA
jgi:ABC-2 type transport system ATP-binding protein